MSLNQNIFLSFIYSLNIKAFLHEQLKPNNLYHVQLEQSVHQDVKIECGVAIEGYKGVEYRLDEVEGPRGDLSLEALVVESGGATVWLFDSFDKVL